MLEIGGVSPLGLKKNAQGCTKMGFNDAAVSAERVTKACRGTGLRRCLQR